MTDLSKKTKIYVDKSRRFPGLVCREVWKLGRDDPRRAIHALKVGFSLTLVSLLYLIEPLFKGVGQNAIWAVMTVVVVLEFTAGATLCKGLNRGFGTLLAASLAFFFEFIAREYGKVFRAVFVGASVFLIGTFTTYLRFYPKIKKNYDYGVLVFLLTFNLITVSSYRVDDILKLAHGRMSTIAIGSGLCILMSIFIFPHWSGEDLHNFTVTKIEGLAKSIEACVDKYFNDEEIDMDIEEQTEDPIYDNYKAVLDSKSTDETLALHSSWEPRHSLPCHKFPSRQYVKLGGVLRHFGYGVVALHGSLQTEIRTRRSVRLLFRDPCIRMAKEINATLTELAGSIRNRRHCSPEILTERLQQALQNLNSALKSQPRLFLGPNCPNNNSNMLALVAATARQKSFNHLTSLKKTDSPKKSGLKTDSPRKSGLKTESPRISKGGTEAEKRILRPTLSKLTITSLEFSEALPFAAFVALLVELVARLDVVIEQVEELGRVACFAEFRHGDDVILDVDKRTSTSTEINVPNAAGAE
uniref:aluminum-activated malate transporter 14-like isoform X2 n=1 Tax=Erigeron canadensis TaxID=72917 RepID=UPI001CB93C51|nr:aluminum-activated malate transporter 14-like isoform X2 [Erigeron canadensis]